MEMCFSVNYFIFFYLSGFFNEIPSRETHTYIYFSYNFHIFHIIYIWESCVWRCKHFLVYADFKESIFVIYIKFALSY